jgi:hypothetical protein
MEFFYKHTRTHTHTHAHTHTTHTHTKGVAKKDWGVAIENLKIWECRQVKLGLP